MLPLLSTRAAAGILGVHESTVKRWCNEGVITSSKTRGGHRRIGLNTILSFAQVQGIEHPLIYFGDDAANVWHVVQSISKTDRFEEAIQLMLKWYKSNRVAQCFQFVCFLLDRGIKMAVLMDHLFGNLLSRVGKEWQQGQISIGYEHLVYHGVRNTLELLGNRDELVSEPGRLALVGCIDGCRHEAGSLMVRAVLEDLGWEVMYVGADVPHEEYAYMQSRTSASLICVSIPRPHGLPEARGLVRQLTVHYKRERPYEVVLGGGGVTPENVQELGGYSFQNLSVFQQLVPFAEWVN